MFIKTEHFYEHNSNLRAPYVSKLLGEARHIC